MLVPGYLLQMCYGMNTAFTAIMTPQLMDDKAEFLINEDQESWIVSIDNAIVLFVSILSGILQTRIGPLKVQDNSASSVSALLIFGSLGLASCMCALHDRMDIRNLC